MLYMEWLLRTCYMIKTLTLINAFNFGLYSVPSNRAAYLSFPSYSIRRAIADVIKSSIPLAVCVSVSPYSLGVNLIKQSYVTLIQSLHSLFLPPGTTHAEASSEGIYVSCRVWRSLHSDAIWLNMNTYFILLETRFSCLCHLFSAGNHSVIQHSSLLEGRGPTGEHLKTWDS